MARRCAAGLEAPGPGFDPTGQPARNRGFRIPGVGAVSLMPEPAGTICGSGPRGPARASVTAVSAPGPPVSPP